MGVNETAFRRDTQMLLALTGAARPPPLSGLTASLILGFIDLGVETHAGRLNFDEMIFCSAPRSSCDSLRSCVGDFPQNFLNSVEKLAELA